MIEYISNQPIIYTSMSWSEKFRAILLHVLTRCDAASAIIGQQDESITGGIQLFPELGSVLLQFPEEPVNVSTDTKRFVISSYAC